MKLSLRQGLPALMLAATLSLGAVPLPSSAATADAGPQYATLVEHRLAFACRGSGPLTVVLVEGMGLDAQGTFKNTYRNFPATAARICWYDRAGVGSSSPLQSARPLKALSDELVALAEQQQWGDLVLVAHSFGGLVARSVLLDHPQRIKGVVFVDAVHESWLDGMKAALSPAGWATMEMIIRWEKETHAHEDFIEAVQSLRERAKRPVPPLPVTVLSRGLPHTQIRQTRMSYADVDAYNASWDAAQARLARDYSEPRQLRMHYASHLFDEQDPWLVIGEIEQLVQRLRAPR